MAELPQYTIRESARAKHVLLKMSLHDGLIVVVPRGFDVRQIPRIIGEKRGWIDRGLERIERQRSILGPGSSVVTPQKISLRSFDEEWRIEYEESSSSRVMLRVHDGERLVLSGNVNDSLMLRAALRRFLIARARKDLITWLESLAAAHGFVVNGVRVGLQKTRWGSCSKRGTISLNAKLLFLPRDLVEYVIIHELCHTVHHNHSRDFWRLVQEHLPRAQTLRRTLRSDAWRFVPLWLEDKGS